MKNDPVVAIAGATGAVGAEFIATTDKHNFRREPAKGASERKVSISPVLRGRAHFPEVPSHRREIGGGSGRQSLGLPHGPERAAGYPRDPRPPHPRTQGHHRQPEFVRRSRRWAALVAVTSGDSGDNRKPRLARPESGHGALRSSIRAGARSGPASVAKDAGRALRLALRLTTRAGKVGAGARFVSRHANIRLIWINTGRCSRGAR